MNFTEDRRLRLKRILQKNLEKHGNKDPSPRMDYRHNILYTARESTKPDTPFENEDESTSVNLVSQIGSLPNLKSLNKGSRRFGLKRGKNSLSSRNLSKINYGVYGNENKPTSTLEISQYKPSGRQINLSIPLCGIENKSVVLSLPQPNLKGRCEYSYKKRILFVLSMMNNLI